MNGGVYIHIKMKSVNFSGIIDMNDSHQGCYTTNKMALESLIAVKWILSVFCLS